MKRRDLVRHLESKECTFLREGGNHTVYENQVNRRKSTVPRHTEVPNNLVKKICRDLGITEPI